LTGGTITPTLTTIETLTITGTTAIATLDLINASGYTTVTLEGSTFLPTVANISSTTPALAVSNTAVGATFGYVASAVSGSPDGE
jgi:hypothetical protein